MKTGKVAPVLVMAICVSIALTGVAAAKWNVFRAGSVILKFDGGISPKVLPRNELAAVAASGRLEIATTDGSRVPAIRGGTFRADRNIAIDAAGLPTCRKGQLEANNSADAKRVCGDSLVGSGEGTVEVRFPESTPILIESPLLFFNGGTKDGTTTLFVHIYVTQPAPVAVITTTKFRRVDEGRFGLRFVTEVPKIAGGSGSVLDARFRLHRLFTSGGRQRSYLRARCPDGHFLFGVVRTEFDIEGLPAGVSPSFSGSLTRPCTPGRG